jgi:uncharacterized protein YecE (DUF72 family)
MSMPTDVRVGCCGFPGGLARYGQTFSVAEVQQTFYQPPPLKTLEKWRTLVPGGFEFTLKAWQLMTHEAGGVLACRFLCLNSNKQVISEGFSQEASVVYSAWFKSTWDE